MSFEARCQPRLWPGECPAAGGRRSVQLGVPQLKRRCLFRRAPPLSARHSLLGPGCLVDRPRWGAWMRCQEEGLAARPLGPRPAQRGGHVQQSGLRASHSRPWGSLSHHGGLVGTSVAATAVTPGPVWGTEGESRAEAWLGSCSSQRRASARAGKPRGRCWLPAAALEDSWPQPGSSHPSSVAGTLVPVPARGSQPSALGIALRPKPLESDGPEFKSRLPHLQAV